MHANYNLISPFISQIYSVRYRSPVGTNPTRDLLSSLSGGWQVSTTEICDGISHPQCQLVSEVRTPDKPHYTPQVLCVR